MMSFGCAGLIIRLLEQRIDVNYYALSRCEELVPPSYPEDTLELECRKATSELGLAEEQVYVMRFPVRNFPQQRQEILELFVKINHQYRPQLVIIPSSYDNHQDHATVNQEGFSSIQTCINSRI